MWKKQFILALALLGFARMTYAQCETWVNSDLKEDALSAHSIYRQELKAKNYENAFEYWKQAYKIAPAADGKRDFHFMDGIKFYKHFLENETDEAKKEEYKKKIIDLYEQVAECYSQKAIHINNCNSDECYDRKIGFILGRQAYDMYYVLNSPREKTYEVVSRSVDMAGKESEYIIVPVYANLLVHQYKQGNIGAETVRSEHRKMIQIVEYNSANNERFADYYQQSARSMEAAIAQIESEVYDCAYFKDKLLPDYRDNPRDGELIRKIYNKLLRQGCDTTEAIMLELRQRYVQYADSVNEQLLAELEAKNPALAGKRLYDEGNYTGAIKKFREAIEIEDNPDKIADYYFRLASIQGRKLRQYARARSNALKAAELKANWGRPYMLIGDLYALTSRNCGDSWNQRLAVLAAIDKYYFAKSVDQDVAAEANEKIARYNSSMPDKETAFMMGYSEGEKVKVGCWIGETVRLRF